MTAPREILPGTIYLVTRRCTQRQFLLKPSRRTNELVRYCLADAARRTGVLLHAFCFMSNHWHGVVTDPLARLPEFLERFHRLFARAQNSALGRWENLWSSDKPSAVALISDEDVLDKMAYTIANPTAAGLVEAPRDWPGVISLRTIESVVIRRPNVFFSANSEMPERVTLETVRPAIYTHLDDATIADYLRRAVERRVSEARDALRKAGRNFVGLETVREQPFETKPKTIEPRRNPNPRIAAKHHPSRLRAIHRLLDFIKRYRAVWHAWRSGERDAIFPAGTYALRVHAGVACAPACPA